MADKFPLVVDGTAIKELPNGDNLELTGSNVVGVGTVALTNLTVGGSQGSDGQVLTSTGSGIAWEDAGQTAAETRTLVDSASDSNVFTDADHSKLDGIEASADVTDATNVTAAGALMDSELNSIASVKALNQGVATTDSPTFAGVTTSGITNTANLKISGAQGSDGQVLTSTGSGVAWEDAGGGGGGVWNVISSQTISSSVSSVTFTGVTGYKVYKLIMTDINYSSSGTADQIQLSSDNGSNFATFGISSIALRYNSGSTSQTFNNDFYQSNKLPLMYGFNEFNNNEKHHVEVTIFGLNDSSFTYTHSRLLSSWGWNANDIGVNETYARTHGSGGLASFNAFKIDGMAGSSYTYDGGTFTLYGLANS
jgi:hypothetical protein